MLHNKVLFFQGAQLPKKTWARNEEESKLKGIQDQQVERETSPTLADENSINNTVKIPNEKINKLADLKEIVVKGLLNYLIEGDPKADKKPITLPAIASKEIQIGNLIKLVRNSIVNGIMYCHLFLVYKFIIKDI